MCEPLLPALGSPLCSGRPGWLLHVADDIYGRAQGSNHERQLALKPSLPALPCIDACMDGRAECACSRRRLLGFKI